jgi:hypothetical protein
MRIYVVQSAFCRIFLSSKIRSLEPLLWISCLHTLIIILLLLIPSKTHVLSTGTYCSVMTLIISCDTIPPVNAPMLCSSAPPARTLLSVSKIPGQVGTSDLQLACKFSNLCLHGGVLVFVDRSTCLFDEVVCYLEGNAGKLLGVEIRV